MIAPLQEVRELFEIPSLYHVSSHYYHLLDLLFYYSHKPIYELQGFYLANSRVYVLQEWSILKYLNSMDFDLIFLGIPEKHGTFAG